MFEKGDEEDLEKEERTRKLEKVESRLKKRRRDLENEERRKKKVGGRREQVHMDFYVHLSFATFRTRVLKTGIPSKNLST